MPERGDASYENNGKERKDQTESGCRGGGVGGWGVGGVHRQRAAADLKRS